MVDRGAGTSRLGGIRRASSALALCVAMLGFGAGAAQAETGTTTDRYTLVKGCFALESAAGNLIAQTGNGYSATAASLGDAEGFRMQATELGKYLFYGEAKDFLGLNGAAVEVATAPSGQTTWIVDGAAGQFTIVNEAGNLALSVNGSDQLVSVPAAQAEAFTFVPADGCAVYPEIPLNATGDPNTNLPRYGEVEGTMDGHMHMMAFEFLSGTAHCGQPWHRFGVEYALRDCQDHIDSDGCTAVLETFLGGDPCHETSGWPNFEGWPDSESLTHENSYYRWLERAHLAGLRVFVNLMVENRVLCKVYTNYPFVATEAKNSCNEMKSVELQIQRINELEDYIDAQAGGPGEGFFRIVENPFQARKAINRGKLAVVMGMEVSEPFNCRYRGGAGELVPGDDPDDPDELPVPTYKVDPRCTPEGINEWLDKLDEAGIRQMEITNKFDNPLTGVAGDGGETGVVIDGGQFALAGGQFWDFGPYKGTCDEHNHDRVPATGGTVSQDEIFGNGLDQLFPGLALPLYGPNDKCNQLGWSDGDPDDIPSGSNLGKVAVDGIMERQMIFDPDHMSEYARGEALEYIVSKDYPGVISSHSWSTSRTLPQVYGLGGMITPYAGGAGGFAQAWEEVKSAEVRDELGDQYFGFGYGADANGFGSQGGPRNPAEEVDVDYPFTGIDGAVTFESAGVRDQDLRHQHGRGRPLRPLCGLAGRPPPDQGRRDRPGHEPRRRGVPADVGAHLRHRRGRLLPVGRRRLQPEGPRHRTAPEQEAEDARCAQPASPSTASRNGAGVRPTAGASPPRQSRQRSASATRWTSRSPTFPSTRSMASLPATRRSRSQRSRRRSPTTCGSAAPAASAHYVWIVDGGEVSHTGAVSQQRVAKAE